MCMLDILLIAKYLPFLFSVCWFRVSGPSRAGGSQKEKLMKEKSIMHVPYVR